MTTNQKYIKKKKISFLFILTCICFFTYCQQSAFDIYGPFNAEVYKDLKSALKNPNQVYKLDLSYQTIEHKILNKIGSLNNYYLNLFVTYII